MNARLALGLVILVAAGVILIVGHGQERVLGLQPEALAGAASLLAIGIVVLGSLTRQFRGRLGHAVEAAAFWMAALALLVLAYSYRFELAQTATRLVGSVVPGFAITGRGGEVSVTRGGGGHFSIWSRVNGVPVNFLFDTGASSVVLTAATARAVGIDPARLDFSVSVSTANGRTLAAPVLLSSIAMGDIEEKQVEALVARPEALQENLLGMSFLGRLASFEVNGDRLILRGAAR